MLITAGPTHEPLDAVRYIANRSSGRMGLALAEAATSRGLSTTLLLGPTPLEPRQHSQLTTIRFRTTGDLQQLLATHWPNHRVLIMAAAVADYRRPGAAGPPKHPRGRGPWHLELQPTPDLVGEMAAIRRPDQTIIGFALEPPDRLLDSAREKLSAKDLDAMVANPLETIGDDRIASELLLRDGRTITAPPCTKREFADWLLDQLETITQMRTKH